MTKQPSIGRRVLDADRDEWERYAEGWRLVKLGTTGGAMWSAPMPWETLSTTFGPVRLV